ncbi:hypothetical protein [Streptacidiphilus jiangxiensis]|uniref:Htaa protein n=1 Tax=Streptacidiphilus jiangxiensis TaxID=235985 RepID=A0A1H7LX78_STRJI|nr:hypothetical protein [Streptacidiphilus jiangxiensis]SEL03590.1 hypothetical protein SAMN05414137_10581 [Streptacidiphilus jiangxiensis]
MQIKRIAVPVAALAVIGAVAASAPSAMATTPASGSLVLTASTAYVKSALIEGIGAVVGTPASASYSTTGGVSATFPVTGGDLNLNGYSGAAQFGGSIVVIDARQHRTVTFTQLAFDDLSGTVTGVPQGSTTPVALLDPSGDLNVTTDATTGAQTLTASETDLDPAAATYLDHALCTAFFKAGTAVGALTLTFTPAS